MIHVKFIVLIFLIGHSWFSICQSDNLKHRDPISRNNFQETRPNSQSKTSIAFAPKLSINYYWNSNSNQWVLLDTSFYMYNSAGYVILKLNRNGSPSKKTTYSYDSNDRLIQEIEQNFSTVNNAWENFSKFSSIYDTKNNLIETTFEYYNSSLSRWDMNSGSKFIFVYNSNNLAINKIWQFWKSTTQSWTNYFQYQNYIYNSSGLLTQFETQFYNNSNWEMESRTNYSYSTSNILTEEIFELWNGTSFENLDRYSNIGWHNWSNSAVTSARDSYTTQIWGTPIANQWNTKGRKNTSYNNFGSSIVLDEVYTNNNWVNKNKRTENYDSNNTYLGSTSEQWNTNTNNWEIKSGTNQIQFYDLNSTLKIIKTIWQTWNKSLSTFENSKMKEYSDFVEVVGISEEPFKIEFKISVYPNPFNTICTLRIEGPSFLTKTDLSIKLYDLFGKEVLKIKVEDSETRIEKGHLSPGIYFYSVLDQTHSVAKGKLVVE